MKKPKKKKCSVRGCKNTFFPRSSLQKACSWKCALILIEKDKDKKAKSQRRADRKRKEELRPRKWYLSNLQKVFNEFIRLRDKGKPCISCGKHVSCKINAGHYYSVGSHPELRYEQTQVHLQCEKCNCFLSGNQAEYRKGLIIRVGLEQVDWIEGPHELPKWTIEELKVMIGDYRSQIKMMKNNQ